MTRHTHTNQVTLPHYSPRLPVIAALAIAFARLVTVWDTRHRTRQRLSELDDHMLNDIGITRSEAHKEAKRSFWLP